MNKYDANNIGCRVRGYWGPMNPTDFGIITGGNSVFGYEVTWDNARPAKTSYHFLRDAGSSNRIGVNLCEPAATAGERLTPGCTCGVAASGDFERCHCD